MAQTKEEEKRDKVVLAGIDARCLAPEENADEESMAELAALVETAGGESVGEVLQNREAPDPRTFIGEGTLEELKDV